jgi:hypothetical protein
MAYSTFVTQYSISTSLEVYSELKDVGSTHLPTQATLYVPTAFGIVEDTLPLAGATLYVGGLSNGETPALQISYQSVGDMYLVERDTPIFVLDHQLTTGQPVEQEKRVLPEATFPQNINWGFGVN